MEYLIDEDLPIVVGTIEQNAEVHQCPKCKGVYRKKVHLNYDGQYGCCFYCFFLGEDSSDLSKCYPEQQ